jgi:Phage integrase, N-terminal SAM-like domain
VRASLPLDLPANFLESSEHTLGLRRYILFHNKRHLKDKSVPEIEAFLTRLAVAENVAASNQNQAFSALLFLYRRVLQIPLDDCIDALRAKRSR